VRRAGPAPGQAPSIHVCARPGSGCHSLLGAINTCRLDEFYTTRYQSLARAMDWGRIRVFSPLSGIDENVAKPSEGDLLLARGLPDECCPLVCNFHATGTCIAGPPGRVRVRPGPSCKAQGSVVFCVSRCVTHSELGAHPRVCVESEARLPIKRLFCAVDVQSFRFRIRPIRGGAHEGRLHMGMVGPDGRAAMMERADPGERSSIRRRGGVPGPRRARTAVWGRPARSWAAVLDSRWGPQDGNGRLVFQIVS